MSNKNIVKIIVNRCERQKIYIEFIRYGTILYDIEFKKNCSYFRRLLIKYNNKIFEIYLKDGFCTKIKNLLT